MKKKISILIILLLFTTGCTCEYNLQIDDDKYKEEVKLTANTTEEISLFNQKWEVSANKNDNVPGGDPSTTELDNSNNYKYNLSVNTLTFNYDFSQTEYKNSTAVSKCYNSFTVTSYQDSIVISTPTKNLCFDNYPSLSYIIVNISTNKKVTSHNADSTSGNTYTWKLGKESSKSINMVIDDTNQDISPSSSTNNGNSREQEPKKKDYTMYIFSGILLVVALIGYLIYKIIKNKGNNMDV